MLAALDIHKEVFQAAVLDDDTGEWHESRFKASRDDLAAWANQWRGQVTDVTVEATTGWRWVCQELQSLGFRMHLADPAQARALRGRTRQAKTDRLDARWLVLLLAKRMLPEAWIPPAEIQQLRDQTRLRLALSQDRRRWAQRLHALLLHEGWPCQRARLLTDQGRRWIAALELVPAARAQVDRLLHVMDAIASEQEEVEVELRRFAKGDTRCQTLMTIFGIGSLLAAHILAEVGDVARFQRAGQLVRAAGLDPTVVESAETRRRGVLAKQGSPELRWALVEAAQHGRSHNSPDHRLYTLTSKRVGTQRAVLTVARKVARRAYYKLRVLQMAA